MAKKQAARDEPGRYAYDGLDRVLHEKARLGIMTSLVARAEGVVFNELKRLCALTDGNLSRHIDVLQLTIFFQQREVFAHVLERHGLMLLKR